MKKLSLAFTLLSSLAFAGTAFADHDRGERELDGRAAIIDHRDDVQLAVPIVPPMAPAAFRGGWPVAPAPVMPGAPMADRGFGQHHWQLLTAQAAPYRRGTFTLAVPPRGSFDQLRLVASQRGLDIVAVQLTYGRGRTELVRPARDGAVSIDLGKGKLRSITVRYINRGANAGASIQVLAKDDAAIGRRGR